jgi:hypothetical protein
MNRAEGFLEVAGFDHSDWVVECERKFLQKSGPGGSRIGYANLPNS